MSDFVYLDNAATTFPKPPEVIRFMCDFYATRGVNPGRTGFDLALEAEDTLLEARQALTDFVGGTDRNRLVFSLNVTDALNLLIGSVLKPGDHAITTRLEHNSVLRPMYQHGEQGVEVDFVPFDEHGFVHPAEIEARIEHLRKMAQQVRVAEEQESTELPDETDQPQEPNESEPDEQKSDEQEQSQVAQPAASSPKKDSDDGSILPWVIGGIGVALIAGGSVTGALTLSMQSELDDACYETRRCPTSEADNIDTAQTMALVTDILLGTGVAALLTGAVLLFVLDDSAESEEPTETAFICSADGCLGTARLRF